jgi:hypothetical protein
LDVIAEDVQKAKNPAFRGGFISNVGGRVTLGVMPGKPWRLPRARPVMAAGPRQGTGTRFLWRRGGAGDGV